MLIVRRTRKEGRTKKIKTENKLKGVVFYHAFNYILITDKSGISSIKRAFRSVSQPRLKAKSFLYCRSTAFLRLVVRFVPFLKRETMSTKPPTFVIKVFYESISGYRFRFRAGVDGVSARVEFGAFDFNGKVARGFGRTVFLTAVTFGNAFFRSCRQI